MSLNFPRNWKILGVNVDCVTITSPRMLLPGALVKEKQQVEMWRKQSREY